MTDKTKGRVITCYVCGSRGIAGLHRMSDGRYECNNREACRILARDKAIVLSMKKPLDLRSPKQQINN